MDSYEPQKTEAVKRLCWSRGYVVVIHGGGATSITQPNDTDLHQHLRRIYTEKESADMVKMAREHPGKIPLARPENCIDWMIASWRDPKLHAAACRGFKYTGITNALDGSEDQFICREAKEFWQSLAVAELRAKAMRDVAVEVERGRLGWTFDDVYKVVLPMPNRGHLDSLKEFQDDEDPVLLDGEKPWAEDSEGEDAQQGEPEGDRGCGEGAPDAEDSSDVESDQPSSGEDEDLGDDDQPDAVGLAKKRSETPLLPIAPALTPEQADVAVKAQAKLVALRQAQEILQQWNLPAVSVTVAKAIHAEERRAKGRLQTDSAVVVALEQARANEEAALERQVEAIRQQMSAEKDVQSAEKRARLAAAATKKSEARLVEVCDLVALRDSQRLFSVEMLGQGHPKGGTALHKKHRMEVLDRLRDHSELPPHQRSDWKWFQTNWDSVMAEEHGSNWGQEFAGIAQGLLEQLERGDKSALGTLMQNEKHRKLSHLPVLRMPGFSRKKG